MEIKEVPNQAELLEENRELKKTIAKLERIIEKLVQEAPQPSQDTK